MEVYAPYEGVTSRASQLWRAFAGITVSSLFALVALMLPLIWRMLSRLRDAQEQRALLLERAVQASNDERRRIAGTLHDGVIQDLAGASYVVSGAAARSEAVQRTGPGNRPARRGRHRPTRHQWHAHPARRHLPPEPGDLGTAGGPRGPRRQPGGTRHRRADGPRPRRRTPSRPAQERLFYRVAHECLLNTVRHARARQVTLSLRDDQDAAVLEISDDGGWFDPAAAVADPAHGHFGLRVLTDLAHEAGAELHVASAPGAGTRWLLRA